MYLNVKLSPQVYSQSFNFFFVPIASLQFAQFLHRQPRTIYCVTGLRIWMRLTERQKNTFYSSPVVYSPHQKQQKRGTRDSSQADDQNTNHAA